jgi:capsular exopolysaccharide synthesis family protein
MQEQYTPSKVNLPLRVAAPYSDDRTFITHADIKRIIKRYSSTILWSAAIGTVLAALYAMTAVPLYTAHTQIIIDPSLPQTLREQGDGIFSIDNAQVESQIEVLKSESIAHDVITELELADDAAFVGSPPPSILSYPFRLFQSQGTPNPFARERNAFARFAAGLAVRRVGLSYSIDVMFSATSPELAAKIANATANAYIAEQIGARAQSARQGGLWLEERIDHLRKQMNAAALQVQEFRAKRDYRISGNRGDAVDPKGRTSEDSASNRPNTINTIEELDSTAQTYRRIYESYLMAYTESVQKQSYPVSNARIITAASPPLGKSHPRTKLLLVFGCLMGAFAGLGIAFCRHKLDRRVWGARQIREDHGLECLASIPRIVGQYPPSRLARFSTALAYVQRPSDLLRLLRHGVEKVWHRLRAKLEGVEPPNGARHGTTGYGLDVVVTMPFSGFSLGMKRLKTAISLAARGHQIRCVAVTSALPSEGKTTIATNLAMLFAMSGVRTLLVDGDVRKATLSRSLAPEAECGIVEAMQGNAKLKDCVVRVNELGLDLMPVSSYFHNNFSEDIPTFDQAELLLEDLKKTYDFIIFEMPPLSASLDGLTMGSILDSTLLVAEWGRTPMPLVSEAIHLLRNAGVKIAGVVINKVDGKSHDYGELADNYFSYTYVGADRRG